MIFINKNLQQKEKPLENRNYKPLFIRLQQDQFQKDNN